MPADRRTPARGSRPAQRRGPGRGTGTGGGARGPARTRVAAAPAAPAPRPRLTGRAAVLILVLAVLTVSYASSLRAYLQQRGDIVGSHTSISEQQRDIEQLRREEQRWSDPEYVRTRARLLGYVLPGETSYVVTRDGKPLEAESALTDPDTIAQTTPPAWFDGAWDSVKLAGHPQKRTSPPLTEIDGSAAD